MHWTTFFQNLWNDFEAIAPAAADIKTKLEASGEVVVNDHVAFRTFDRAPIALEDLQPHILAMGYAILEDYDFEDKKLHARAYVHPDATAPRVFISELLVDQCSAELRAVVDGLVAELPADIAATPDVFWSGRPWAPIPYATWEALSAESEYAAWLCALGFRANHFTVSINHLSPALGGVEAVLARVEAYGHRVNASGGRVKGTPAELLEQGSTMADRLPLPFADCEAVVPTCYYEFALRHPTATGVLYPGFIAASADKIFESTDARR
jgi:hypothetical protein